MNKVKKDYVEISLWEIEVDVVENLGKVNLVIDLLVYKVN